MNDNAHLAPPSVADGKQAQGWLIEGRRRGPPHRFRAESLSPPCHLKAALANFAHQLDAFEARVGHQSKAPQVHCLASTDSHLASIVPQIAFANEVVAEMKNHLTENRAMIGMRRGELSWRGQRGF